MSFGPRRRHALFAPLAGALTCLGVEAGAQSSASAAIELPVVTVTAPDSPTGPAHGVVARRALSATKTDSLIMDTPQSISVITYERMQMLGAQSVRQAVDYTAGVTVGGTDNRRDTVRIRGTDATRYLNGLLDNVGYNSTTRADPYTLERIDVIKGPSGMLYGQGAIGGIFNLVSKRPQADAAREIGVSYGSDQRKQIQADLTGPLSEDGRWMYRLIALGRDSNSSVQHVPDDRYVLAPALTYQHSAATSLTLLGNFQKDVTGSMIGFFPWRGMLYNKPGGKIPRGFFVSEPGFDRFTAHQQALGYQFDHAFNDAVSLRQNLRYQRSKVDYRSIYVAGFRGATHGWLPDSDRLLSRTLYANRAELQQLLVDTTLQYRFATQALAHTMITGLDYQRSRLASRSGVGGSAQPLDVFQPVYGNYTAPTHYKDNPTQRGQQLGVYLQDQIEWRQWLALLGLRHDSVRASASGVRTGTQDDGEITKRLGLMYRAANGLHPYISYAESFQGEAGFNKANQPFKPLRGEQWEAGVKYQPPGENLMVTASLFDMTERNRKMAGIVNGLPDQIQAGKVRSKGLELEARASMGSWDVIANYSHVDARLARGPAAEEGRRLASVPADSASLWLSRRFSAWGVSGLQAGAGARYVSARVDELGQNRVPGVTLYDAMVAYESGPMRLAVNALNVFDKQHLTSCIKRGDCFFGEGRSVVASLSYRF